MKRAYTKPISETSAADYFPLAKMAWDEDCPDQDITSVSLFSPDQRAIAYLNAREEGILCGSGVSQVLSKLSDGDLQFNFFFKDGEKFVKGDKIAEIQGSLLSMLRVERILLNFLQYLSGISTSTRKVVDQYGSKGIMILDTRKTLPGYRKLAKYAVYCGGGSNHRLDLSEMAMIKDNHLALFGSAKIPVGKIRSNFPGRMVELEIDSLDQLEDALEAEPDVLMLDNFNIPDTRKAFQRVKEKNTKILIECSGGITPEKLEALSEFPGVGVSMGYLTHTTRFLDLGLDIRT
ncbi:carboxylating nicotinate-nucleotide diphosphorylase [Leptospira licerasiae]|uniref:nicotinate-nucleotide diphosphorylase (carboxylating) n=1 Tax=Leptospira licerasiae str. MMD4847 TaxID=1049971 RepID=A0ABN0H5K5_9LEPT|nr:carboxylating nicotinate-nucleotide diphosphorylase [Leptospira licerasiae]EIE00692.1 nicotinate-nucleotide diphosphorylase (carboxylating) [Leptospira licerasiae serovar Varillal str. VAR 010]EJZ40935.1 nicotinate-nucleotide diphosphorylase (carboxylating) [Leptospira licerasiae str. MMD4847]